MGNNPISNTEVTDILFKKILGEEISPENQSLLDKWAAASIYNKSLLGDITYDTYLKKQLADAYHHDRSMFWDIVIAYRSAMHNGMERPGNFWSRIIRRVRKILGFGTKRNMGE
jgi:hypothetical protein